MKLAYFLPGVLASISIKIKENTGIGDAIFRFNGGKHQFIDNQYTVFINENVRQMKENDLFRIESNAIISQFSKKFN